MELIKVENNVAILTPETSKQLAVLEEGIKQLKEKQDALKQALLEEMEKEGVIKLETDDVAITYIAPADVETFDSKTFKAEFPDLYDNYVKMSTRKSSIRIKVK